MDNSTHVSLSLASAMMRNLDVTTNNIANANTTGFKSERIVFESYLHRDEGRAANEETAYVLDRGSYLDESQGAVTRTGNPLDVALEGQGWLSYRTPEGQTAYGRDGRFTIDQQGNLVTVNGAQVLDAGGGPIALPPDLAGGITISADGSISAGEAGVIGQLGIFTLADAQAYERIGGGMFIPPENRETQPPLPDVDTKVVQGAVETSNVQPVVELTRMMEIQRAYERSIKMLTGNDDLRRDTLSRLARAV